MPTARPVPLPLLPTCAPGPIYARLLRRSAGFARLIPGACRTAPGARPLSPSVESLEAREVPSALGDAALSAVLQRAADPINNFIIYRDADSGANHGFASGKFASGNDTTLISALRIDPAAVNDPNAPGGTSTDPAALDRTRGTVLRVDFPALASGQFVGLNVEDPESYGESRAGVGYDLRGATALVLEARSPTPGGLRVQFGLGERVTDRTAPILLTDTSQTFTIPLDTLRDPNTNALSPTDLSNVHVLFSVVTSGTDAAGGGTAILDNIRLTPVPANPTGALPAVGLPRSFTTFGVVPAAAAPVPLDQVLANLTTVYESSLAGTALLARGAPADRTAARGIADAFVYALHNDNVGAGLPVAPDGSHALHDGYSDNAIALFNDQNGQNGKNGKRGQVRLAGFTADPALGSPNGFYLVQDGATGGNNAFAVMFLTDAYHSLGDVRYLDAAEEIGNWIVGNLADTSGTGYGGYFVGYAEGGGTSTSRLLLRGKSVENNADIFAAFTRLAAIDRELGDPTRADLWTARAKAAGDFVMAMYTPGDPNDASDGHFNAGTVPAGTAPAPGLDPSGPQRGNDVINRFLFLDSDSFVTLALAGSAEYRNAIDWREPTRHMVQTFAKSVQATTGGQTRTFSGFSLVTQPTATSGRPNPGADGVAWEFTGQAVVDMQYIDRLYGENNFAATIGSTLDQIRQAQTSAPFTDGAAIPASTLQGENESGAYAPVDQGLTTPFQVIPERPALAATLWGALADAGVNVFVASPVVTVAVSDPSAGERGAGQSADAGQFILTRIGDTSVALTVNVTIGGTATAGLDYTTNPATTTQVTFAAGSATATVTVTPIDDSLVEGSETTTLTVNAGTGYAVGATATGTVTIADDDTAPSGGGGTGAGPPNTTGAMVSGGSLVQTKSDGSKTTLAVPAGTTAGVIGDLNGNGGNDVLVILPNGAIAVVDGTTGQLVAVAGLDFNGDGFKDVLLFSPNGAPRTFFDGRTGLAFPLGG